MQSGEKLLNRLLDALLPNRAAPVLARVIKAHEGPGKTKYSVDVKVVTAGTLEDTDQIISEVPLSPIWTSKKGTGVYAIPSEDTVVIIEFVNWNPAYPYVAGIWSDDYEAGDFKKEHFIITDGKGFKLDFAEGDFLITDGKDMKFEFKEGTLTVTDKNGAKIGIDTSSLLFFKSKEQTLKAVLEKFVDEVVAIKTMGPPPQHVVSPDSIQKLNAIKQEIAKLLK